MPTYIHNLQTELRNEMNTLQQGLQPQPTSPQGFPTWWTIMAAGQIPSHTSDCLPEGSRGHAGGPKRCFGRRRVPRDSVLHPLGNADPLLSHHGQMVERRILL